MGRFGDLVINIVTVLFRCDVSKSFVTKMSDSLSKKWGGGSVSRVGSIVFYAVMSLSITLINRNILVVREYPSFCVLGMSQMVSTLIILSMGKAFGFISFPSVSLKVFSKLWPLPLTYTAKMFFGLWGTQQLAFSTVTYLRKFTLVMTIFGEKIILKKRLTEDVKYAVAMIIFGSLVTTNDDLALNVLGFLFVMMENAFSAANIVFIKRKLDCEDLGIFGLMFYTSLFVILPVFFFALLSGELSLGLAFAGWRDPVFCFEFFLCSTFGFFLMFSMVLCAYFNSPLSVAVISCVKNAVFSIVGIYLGTEYVFSPINFCGMMLCLIGTFFYLAVEFFAETPDIEDFNVPKTIVE